MSPSNRVFSAFAFLSFVMTSIPFAWHLEAWNTGTCIYMGWVSIGSLFLFINSVVWDGNAINWAPVWCDITTKFFIGMAFGIPSATLAINRRLHHIVRITSVTRTLAEKRKAVYVDLAIGVGIPVLGMILHIVYQGHRANIYEDFGCWPSIYNTWVTYLLFYGPTLVVSTIASVYAALNIVIIWKRYAEFKQLLSNGNSSATFSRYIRLMCLASVELLADVPINLVNLIRNVRVTQPWISWEETHFDFWRIDQFPAIVMRSIPGFRESVEQTRWITITCGFVFFAFFGFADEALNHYRMTYNFFAKRLGLPLVYVSGVSPPSGQSNPRRINDTSGGSNGTGAGSNGTPKKGALRGGDESWMSSFTEFANRIKLRVFVSTGSTSFGSRSTVEEGSANGSGLPRHNKELTEKINGVDSRSLALTELTQLDNPSTSDISSGLTWADSLAEKKLKDTDSVKSEVDIPIPLPLRPPPIPPKDYPRDSGKTINNRSLPKQALPMSVSPINDSFLDLSISGLELPPIRDHTSSDRRLYRTNPDTFCDMV